MHPLFGPRLKIKRAYEHIDDINRIIASAFSGDVYGFVVEVDAKTGDRILKIRFNGSIEPLYARVPEAIYQLRSALDQFAVALASANRVADTSRIYFPFASDKDKYFSKDTQGKVDGISATAIDLIHKTQPYKGGDNNLYGLSKLANIDKHNWLIPVGTIGSVGAIRNLKITGGSVGLIIGGGNRLDEGIPISNLGASGSFSMESLDHSKPNFQITGSVAFGDVEVFKGQSIPATLLKLTKLVDGIVESIGKACLPSM